MYFDNIKLCTPNNVLFFKFNFTCFLFMATTIFKATWPLIPNGVSLNPTVVCEQFM